LGRVHGSPDMPAEASSDAKSAADGLPFINTAGVKGFSLSDESEDEVLVVTGSGRRCSGFPAAALRVLVDFRLPLRHEGL
jgi:hypothetical protein